MATIGPGSSPAVSVMKRYEVASALMGAPMAASAAANLGIGNNALCRLADRGSRARGDRLAVAQWWRDALALSASVGLTAPSSLPARR